jgi:hypothetical protein
MVECDDAVAREATPPEPLLQLAASGYERAQRDRIRYGEQLRAILQGRDARWELSVDVDPATDVDALLREIRDSGGGPVPMLGRLYCAAWKQECEMGAQMHGLIEESRAFAQSAHGDIPDWVAWRLERMEVPSKVGARIPVGGRTLSRFCYRA